MTYGGRLICNACGGKGRVMCHTCFSKYGDNPNDIKKIRKIMDQTLDYAKMNSTTFSFQIWLSSKLHSHFGPNTRGSL
jgi:hypothetical protein